MPSRGIGCVQGVCGNVGNRDSLLDAVIAALIGVVVGTLTNSHIGTGAAIVALGLILVLRYRDAWRLVVRILVIALTLIVGGAVAVWPASPALVHLRLVSWRIEHFRKNGGTAIRADIGFINDGGGGLVKKIGGFSVGPNDLQRRMGVDMAQLARAMTVSPADLHTFPYVPVEPYEGESFTITSWPLDQGFFREYEHGTVFFYADVKIYQKTFWGDRLVQDICLYTTGSTTSYDSCPER